MKVLLQTGLTFFPLLKPFESAEFFGRLLDLSQCQMVCSLDRWATAVTVMINERKSIISDTVKLYWIMTTSKTSEGLRKSLKPSTDKTESANVKANFKLLRIQALIGDLY